MYTCVREIAGHILTKCMYMCFAIQPTELEPTPSYDSVSGLVNDAGYRLSARENPEMEMDTPAAPVLYSEQQQNVRTKNVHTSNIIFPTLIIMNCNFRENGKQLYS